MTARVPSPPNGKNLRESCNPYHNDKDALLVTDGGLSRADYYDLTGFRRDILRAIHHLETTDTDTSGTNIRTYLQDLYDDPVLAGHTYTNLDTLIETGFVNKSQIDGRTNRYTLTKRGRQILESVVRGDANRVLDDYPERPVARVDGGTQR